MTKGSGSGSSHPAGADAPRPNAAGGRGTPPGRRTRGAGGPPQTPRPAAARPPPPPTGQHEVDGEPAQIALPGRDRAARRLDEAACHREPDPRALAARPLGTRGPIELLEQPLAELGCDAGTVVLDRQHDRIRLAVAGRDADARAVPRVAHGVV